MLESPFSKHTVDKPKSHLENITQLYDDVEMYWALKILWYGDFEFGIAYDQKSMWVNLDGVCVARYTYRHVKLGEVYTHVLHWNNIDEQSSVECYRTYPLHSTYNELRRDKLCGNSLKLAIDEMAEVASHGGSHSTVSNESYEDWLKRFRIHYGKPQHYMLLRLAQKFDAQSVLYGVPLDIIKTIVTFVIQDKNTFSMWFGLYTK